MPADTVQLVSKTNEATTFAVLSSNTDPVSIKTGKFAAKFTKGWIEKEADAEQFAGVAFYEIFYVNIIEADTGETYLSHIEQVFRVNEQNTVPQNRYLKSKLEGTVVDHDLKLIDFVVPPKTQFILDKLNA